MRRAPATLGAALWAACLGASAQLPTATPPEPALSSWATPQGAARAFQQACVLTGGEAAAAVDWALSEGFEPADVMQGNLDGLLAGQAGSVLVAPGSRGRVVLAAAQGRQCTVWADRMPGPAVRAAVAEMVGQLGAKGARVQLHAERSIERAGAWRQQVQWRYRAVGASQDIGVGSITTLSNAPATQALHVAPMAAAPGYAPDGLPMR